MKERVVVGMSGGIDSFVTALLLQQQGYEVVGVNLVLWKENDLTEAENICRRLGIPLVVRHGESLFRQWVIDPFVAGYTAGQTPSPCCVCNSYVKWELLHQAAEELGASWIATGHYVRQVEIDGRYYIRCGVDPVKDQSYFLWGIPQHILAKALTPLGDYLKSEVKAWALAHGYERMAKRRESMGVCFLQGCDYRSFVRGQRGRGMCRATSWTCPVGSSADMTGC